MDASLPALARGKELVSPRRRLRLAVVTETFPPEVNGVAMTIGRLLPAMEQRGHRVSLVRPRQGEADCAADSARPTILVPGVPLPRYPNLRMGLPASRALARAWREQRPDLVHVVTEGPLGWSAVAVARRLGLPVTSAFHTNFHAYSAHYGLGWLSGAIAGYLRLFHNRTALTLVPTDTLRRELAAQGFHHLEVLSRGVDTQLFHPQRRDASLRAHWGAGPDTPVVLYVGRLAPEKNLLQLLGGFSALRARRGDARLVLVGDGPMRAQLERLRPDAIFAGTRRGEDLAVHYASADVFLFPSLTETFGNVTLEAMASGLAVLAYDYAAAHELITHGEDGLLAPFAANEDFCAEAAKLADLNWARTLGRAARRRALAMDWSCVHDRFETILMRVLLEQERRSHANALSSRARAPERL